MTSNKILKLDLCSTINQLDSTDRYVFFPFSATHAETQLAKLQKSISLLPNDLRPDVAKKLSYIGLGFKEDGKYEDIGGLTKDVLNDIKNEATKCFGPQAIVSVQNVITISQNPNFHFDVQVDGSFRIMVPIMGDTTLFSQSTNKANPGRIEAIPHQSMAVWRATPEGALHSAPPVSQNPRFSILISIITKDCIYNKDNTASNDHPSIKEINEYSIANEYSLNYLGAYDSFDQ